jgi:hypothetical protein
MALSLLMAEAALLVGETSGYESARALLRRAPDYGRAYAIHHAAARALAASGQMEAARAASERWLDARNEARARLPDDMQSHFDLLPEAQEPGAS